MVRVDEVGSRALFSRNDDSNLAVGLIDIEKSFVRLLTHVTPPWQAVLVCDDMKDSATTSARLVEFEERAASLYLTLARRFADNADLSWFWLQMSMEEKQHAQLLEFCGCEHLVAEGLPDNSTVQSLSRLLSSLEERVGQANLSVDEAFLIAAELEGSEINDVYAGVVRPIEGTWYIMRKKIETLVSDHVGTLVEAARKFGASTPTLARLAEIKRRDTPLGLADR